MLAPQMKYAGVNLTKGAHTLNTEHYKRLMTVPTVDEISEETYHVHTLRDPTS